MRKPIALVSFLLLFFSNSSFSQYNIHTIPNPKTWGQDYFVSNPDNVFDLAAVDSLNKICTEIEKATTAEVAIVAVNDFEGSSDFDFAYNLFNHWGLGKKESNNGLLLFIARDRRKYQFITGRGMEGTLPDVSLATIGENYLVPKFKLGDYGGGTIDAINAIKIILLSPDSTEALKAEMKKHSFWYKNQIPIRNALAIIAIFSGAILWSRIVSKRFNLKKAKMQYNLWGGCGCVVGLLGAILFIALTIDISPKRIFNMKMLPFITLLIGTMNLLFEYINVRSRILETYKDEENIVKMLNTYNSRMAITMILSPIVFFFLIGYFRRKHQLRLRLVPPDEPGNWERLNRDSITNISKYLTKGMQEEEKIKSRSFEIWKELESGKVNIVPWKGRLFNYYEDCPKCNFHSLSRPHTITIKSATYSSTGLGKKVQDCKFCDFEQSLGTVVLPKLVKSSSTSGSGGGGSSSGGGSWGGGSSGGGGAGGSW